MSHAGCNTTCGNGVRTITRGRDPPLSENLHGGTPCEGDDEKTMTCNLLTEAQDTAAQQERHMAMLRSCSSDCSTELPADYEPELNCTTVLPSCAVTCTCNGGNSNKYTCSDGDEGYCAEGQECHNADGFNKDQLDSGCRGM